ncbi:TetR/AcrR family transcriptional regulator [Nocardia panacis]|uniref:TetR/AcrR family transcriptional regulator n=1 Tax=Nocardia panacis TaxID=2340916 RepID=A0A3A4KKM6_9NOCA|nr:TetR/AcrR family transcriptional regulator [Nocardia panacis]RJO75612.1 TetR/AcrR family transcriptional regulator [Nocardia panacis]
MKPPTAPRRSGRRERPDGRSRREELIKAAAALFAAHGYRDTSLADIAARVGVTQQALLYYFGSKAGLLHAVIDARDGESVRFATELATLGGVRALDRIPEFAERNIADPDLARLFAVLVAENLTPGDLAHDHFVQRYRNLRGIIASMIEAGLRSGEFRAAVSPELKAVEIVAFIEGVNAQWLLDPDAIDLAAVTTAFTRDLIKTLTAAP